MADGFKPVVPGERGLGVLAQALEGVRVGVEQQKERQFRQDQANEQIREFNLQFQQTQQRMNEQIRQFDLTQEQQAEMAALNREFERRAQLTGIAAQTQQQRRGLAAQEVIARRTAGIQQQRVKLDTARLAEAATQRRRAAVVPENLLSAMISVGDAPQVTVDDQGNPQSNPAHDAAVDELTQMILASQSPGLLSQLEGEDAVRIEASAKIKAVQMLNNRQQTMETLRRQVTRDKILESMARALPNVVTAEEIRGMLDPGFDFGIDSTVQLPHVELPDFESTQHLFGTEGQETVVHRRLTGDAWDKLEVNPHPDLLETFKELRGISEDAANGATRDDSLTRATVPLQRIKRIAANGSAIARDIELDISTNADLAEARRTTRSAGSRELVSSAQIRSARKQQEAIEQQSVLEGKQATQASVLHNTPTMILQDDLGVLHPSEFLDRYGKTKVFVQNLINSRRNVQPAQTGLTLKVGQHRIQ